MTTTKEFEKAVRKEMARIGREIIAPTRPDLADTLDDDDAIPDTFAALEMLAAATERASWACDENTMAEPVARDDIRDAARAMLGLVETLENWNDELVALVEKDGYKIRAQAIANIGDITRTTNGHHHENMQNV